MSDELDDYMKWLLEEDWWCKDCSTHTGAIGDYYMLNDDLWASFGVKGMLCIACVETRLGRPLTKHDFKDVPLNKGVYGMSATLHRILEL